jgi:hypothetical protein
VVLPVLVLVLVVAVQVLRVASVRAAAQDAASVAARVAARGEPPSAVRGAAAALAPPGSSVDVRHTGGDWVVTVTAHVAGHGPAARFVPDVVVTGRAIAADEAAP